MFGDTALRRDLKIDDANFENIWEHIQAEEPIRIKPRKWSMLGMFKEKTVYLEQNK